METDLKNALRMLLDIFRQNAGGLEETDTINKKQLYTLLVSELPVLKGRSNEADRMVKDLDKDGDGTMNFEEFFGMVCKMAMFLRADIAK